MRSFSSLVIDAPGDCSPSRKVVSKMISFSALAAMAALLVMTVLVSGWMMMLEQSEALVVLFGDVRFRFGSARC